MLEIIVRTIEEAQAAHQYGAGRVELLAAYEEGGVTPSYGLIKEMQRLVPIRIMVMVRPHARGFVYSPSDLSVMQEDIRLIRSMGVYGVVLGVLDEQRRIDTRSLEILLSACEGLYVTFHRAIEETEDLVASARLLARYPAIRCILTSGGKSNPENNIDTLRRMQDAFPNGDILVGGGVNAHNIPILHQSGFSNLHIGKAAHLHNDINAPLDKAIFDLFKPD